MPTKKKSILNRSREETTITIFAMLAYVYIVGPIISYFVVEEKTSPISAIILGLPIYIFGVVIAKKRKMISLLPIMLGIVCTIFCSNIGNVDKIIIKFSDITIKTILPLLLSAIFMIIDLVIISLYCVKTENEKILRIQKYLFIPFLLLNIASVTMILLIIFN